MPLGLLDHNPAVGFDFATSADSAGGAELAVEAPPRDFIDADFAPSAAAVGDYLKTQGYRFTAVTPASHQRVLARDPDRSAATLRDIFGWNLPFAADALPSRVLRDLDRAGLVLDAGGLLRSRVRFATLDGRLHVHDALAMAAPEAVVCGPDTCRFVTAVRHLLRPCQVLVEVCCGTGAGGLAAAARCEQVVFADANPRALAMVAANSLLSQRTAAPLLLRAELFTGLDLRPDAIIANPPQVADPRHITQHGGACGSPTALRVVAESLARLAPGGQLILHTTAPIVAGKDTFAAAALPLATIAGAAFTYSEIDPDVHGERLELPAYRDVDRIAAVVLSLTMPG